MATNKLGSGTRNVGVNVTEELRAKLLRLAKSSGMSLSKYCRSVLESAAQRNMILEQRIVEASHTGAEPAEDKSKRSVA